MGSSDWVTAKQAAEQTGRKVRQVYRWFEKPEKETGIARITIGSRKFYGLESILEYEATVKVGRPRNQ